MPQEIVMVIDIILALTGFTLVILLGKNLKSRKEQ